MVEEQITEYEAGQRLDKYLHKYLKEAENGFIYKMLRKKNITLNGKKASGREILLKQDMVRFYLSDETLAKFKGKSVCGINNDDLIYQKAYTAYGSLPILYENKHVVIVNKPAGILSQQDKKDSISLNEWLIGRLLHEQMIQETVLDTFRPSICNRLDRNTSGIVICSKTLSGSQTMTKCIHDRTVKKFYRCLVYGKVTSDMRLDGYLAKDEKSNTAAIIPSQKVQKNASHPAAYSKKKYDFIQTVFHVLAFQDSYSYLEVELITGKTHQIRAHLASIGHPILGDRKYETKEAAEGNKLLAKSYGYTGQLLHACRLEFPVMDDEFLDMSKRKVTAPIPEAFRTAAKAFHITHLLEK